MNKEQVLRLTNFRDYSPQQLIEMIRMMQAEIISTRHNRDFEIENLRHQILSLDAKIKLQESNIQN